MSLFPQHLLDFHDAPMMDRPLRVLVACEFSGIVRDAFAAMGHFARSVDLLPTEALSEPVRYRHEFGCISGHAEYDPACDECVYGEPWCHRCDAYAYECLCLGPTEDEAEYADDCEHGARHLSGDLFTVWDIDSYDLLIAHPPCTYLANSGVRWLHERPERWAQLDEAAEFFRRVLDLPVPRICVENPVPHRYAVERIGRTYDQTIQPWQFGHGETKRTCLWLRNLPPLVPTKVVEGREARIHRMPPGPERQKERSRFFPGVARAMAEQWGGRMARDEVAA